MKELYELKEKLCDELKGYGKKDMSAGSLEVVDKLAHTIKNLDKIIEGYEKGESNYYPYAYDDGMNRGSYRGRMSYNDGSYRYSRHNLQIFQFRILSSRYDYRTTQRNVVQRLSSGKFI